MQLLIENPIDVNDQIDLLNVTQPVCNDGFVLFRNGEVDTLLNARCFVPIMLSE